MYIPGGYTQKHTTVLHKHDNVYLRVVFIPSMEVFFYKSIFNEHVRYPKALFFCIPKILMKVLYQILEVNGNENKL